ncbi:aspartate kinase [Synechococcus sp. PCC 7502]|uniref:aspartate kinase n=1 Tax=Synechococcus sp. PCC 7502 TaxID=1173263 RepID=UPI00029FF947|nr:aspartate kinase [Synechococcus sp. PCC 7502]AFY72511.1 aspartate kinase [Synechococcus sp. PCC 7502]
MTIIVQKYGGSSVADADRIKAVSDRIKKTVTQGNQVVVVVSAMGKTTDGLVKLATSLSDQPNGRELDLLLAAGEQISIALVAMGLQTLGLPAIALTGNQVRIITEDRHTRARILSIETARIKAELDQGRVVVIAGFQGIAQDSYEITTLGRGGSDTSAVAIAAALQADLCEIYTDVPGILTTDPRLVPNAQLLSEISCDEMLELASLGAKVLHPRAVEIARNFGIKLAVRSSWLDDLGTIVTAPAIASGNLHTLEVNKFVDGVCIDQDQAKIALLHIPDRPGIAFKLFGAFAEAGIDVDLIIQSVHKQTVGSDRLNDIAFTVSKKDLERSQILVNSLSLGAKHIVVEDQIAKVSIVGVGIVGRPGIVAKMFLALAEAGVNIQLISTSEIKVSCVIASEDSKQAIATLQKYFDVPIITTFIPVNPAADQIPVRGVALDQNQAQLAILQVPDRPGIAAGLLQQLAERGVCVDMIIQSQPNQNANDIAFTLPSSDLHLAETVLQQAASKLGYRDVISDGAIAKVSIVGAGMINQPGIAARMFKALAQANINIEMIATSEIKVSCVVHQDVASIALRAIHTEFNLGGNDNVLVGAAIAK